MLAASPALAAPNINELTTQVANQGGYTTAGVTEFTLSETIGRVIKVALSLVGTVFLVLTVYAGILWMTASGNEEQVTKAIGILKRATIGLVIVMTAYGVTVFVVAAITMSAGAPSSGVGGGSGDWWAKYGRFFF